MNDGPLHRPPRPAPRRRDLPWSRRLLFSAGLVLFTLLLLELVLHVLAAVCPPVDRFLATTRAAPILDDARLGWRPIPNAQGNDRLGWRNARVPDAIDVLALGDSQTYGEGVRREEAWPAKLGTLGGLSTYNMSYGGYGPAHSVLLMQEALALEPRIVIEGLYAGNDIFDAYSLVVERNQCPELKSTDPQVLRDIEEAERARPLRERIGEGWASFVDVRMDRAVGSWTFERFFVEYSRLNGLVRELRARVRRARSWDEEKRLALQAAEGRPRRLVLESGPIRTVLNPARRLAVLELDDPRMAEGQRICLEALRALDRMARSHRSASPRRSGARFLTLLIPTKELVFHERAEDTPGATDEAYRALVRNERAMWAKTRAFLEAQGIAYVDALPALRRSIEEGRQPYPASEDGHPNAAGHAAIAAHVLRELRDRGWVP